MNRITFIKVLAALLVPGTHGDWVVTPSCKPKEGEERCPLGHYQKPFHLHLGEGSYIDAGEPTSTVRTLPGILVHICYTCGIVYAPVKGASKGV